MFHATRRAVVSTVSITAHSEWDRRRNFGKYSSQTHPEIPAEITLSDFPFVCNENNFTSPDKWKESDSFRFALKFSTFALAVRKNLLTCWYFDYFSSVCHRCKTLNPTLSPLSTLSPAQTVVLSAVSVCIRTLRARECWTLKERADGSRRLHSVLA